MLFAQVSEQVGHLDGGARRFGAAIDLILEATLARLLFAFQTKHGMRELRHIA